MFTNNLTKSFASFLIFIGLLTSENGQSKTVTILSIDGGGIRGMIPAMFLQELENRVGMPIHKMFDQMIGTSTGGIIALGLAVPDKDGASKYTAADLVDIYETQGKRIFQSSVFRQGVFRSRYDHTGLEQLLLQKFGSVKLSEALTNVAVTSYDIEQGLPYTFSSAEAKKTKDSDYFLKDAARATSAAPTYFSPAKIHSVADEGHKHPRYMIDGGVIANNPSILAYSLAHRDFPDSHDYLLISLGTGDGRQSITPSQINGGGALFWASALIDVMINGVSTKNHNMMNRIFPHQENAPTQKYYRFQAPLPPDLMPMDETSKSHIASLKVFAKKMIKENAEIIDEAALAIRKAKGMPQKGVAVDLEKEMGLAA